MPDAAFTHTVRGYFGEELTIGAYPPEDEDDGGAVQFMVRDEQGRTATAHISSPAEREALARALMEAYRVADGEPRTEADPQDGGQAGPVTAGGGITLASEGDDPGFRAIRAHGTGLDGRVYVGCLRLLEDGTWRAELWAVAFEQAVNVTGRLSHTARTRKGAERLVREHLESEGPWWV